MDKEFYRELSKAFDDELVWTYECPRCKALMISKEDYFVCPNCDFKRKKYKDTK